jgi:hypothetical protein
MCTASRPADRSTTSAANQPKNPCQALSLALIPAKLAV